MKMPPAIEHSVRKQNIKFMHNRNQFSAEYFQFIKKLMYCNPYNINRQNLNEKLVSLQRYKVSIFNSFLFTNGSFLIFQNSETEELAMLSIQLASRFLFYTGLHTKKTLRGTAMDWYDILSQQLRSSKAVRSWFANEVLFKHPHRYQK